METEDMVFVLFTVRRGSPNIATTLLGSFVKISFVIGKHRPKRDKEASHI